MIILELSDKQKQIIEGIKTDVKRLTADDFSGHDYLHSERVMNTAIQLQQNEGGDLFLIIIAALLHDLDDKKLSPETYKEKQKARKILSAYDFVDDDIEAVIGIIDAVSYSGGKTPLTSEGKIVQDADRLDALGAIGIARCFAFGGSNSNPIYTVDDFNDRSENSNSSLMHFYNKLLRLASLMNTECGRSIALKRTLFIEHFLDELLSEIKCTDI